MRSELLAGSTGLGVSGSIRNSGSGSLYCEVLGIEYSDFTFYENRQHQRRKDIVIISIPNIEQRLDRGVKYRNHLCPLTPFEFLLPL